MQISTTAGPAAPIARAREQLSEPARPEPLLGALAAAGLAAVTALMLAASVILGPFWIVNSPPDAADIGQPPY
jgi:hypothetical protein